MKTNKEKEVIAKILTVITTDYFFNKKYNLSTDKESVCKNIFTQMIKTGMKEEDANLLINYALLKFSELK